MSNTFFPLFKTNLKISFDFRGKKQKASMLSVLILITIGGMAFAGIYGFIFAMAAMETNSPLVNVLYTMGGFASILALSTTIPKVKTTLFGGNDYDMLAAMPIPKKEILFVKFFSLYLVEFFYSVIILLPSGIICFILDKRLKNYSSSSFFIKSFLVKILSFSKKGNFLKYIKAKYAIPPRTNTIDCHCDGERPSARFSTLAASPLKISIIIRHTP